MSEFCVGCGKDMWEYSEEEQEEGWCISCSPELYEWDAKFGSGVDPVSGVGGGRMKCPYPDCDKNAEAESFRQHAEGRHNDFEPWKNAEVLKALYHGEQMAGSAVADSLGCENWDVYNWMEKFDLARRSKSDANQMVGLAKPPAHRTDQDGYEIIRSKVNGQDSRVYHHRLLAVAVFGFGAVVDKQVHHSNGLTWGNWPSNIELKTPAAHTQLHNSKLSWTDRVAMAHRYRDGGITHRELAEAYDIDHSTVTRAIKKVSSKSDEWDAKFGSGVDPVSGVEVSQ